MKLPLLFKHCTKPIIINTQKTILYSYFLRLRALFSLCRKKSVCMRNENVQFTLRAGYLGARLSQIKKKSRDK